MIETPALAKPGPVERIAQICLIKCLLAVIAFLLFKKGKNLSWT